MKTRTTLPAAFVFFAGLLSAAMAFTYESANELLLNADLDGDGREDVVIADRVTGAFRLGYQSSAGDFVWADARPCGIANLVSAVSGRMLNLSQDALAFGSVEANRVNVFSAPSPAVSSQPIAVYPKGLDLTVLVSLNAAIAPVTPFDDLVCATTNGIGAPNHAALFASSGSDFAFAVENTSFGAWKHGNRVQLNKAGKNYAGVTVASGNGDGFRVFSFDSGNGSLVAGIDGLPSGSRFVTGQFAGNSYYQFVFYAPGSSNLLVCSARETSPGIFGFNSLSKFSLEANIDQLFCINEGGAPALLALISDGEEARVYHFNGTAQPVLQQTFSADVGQSFTGAIPFGNNGFQLLGAPLNAARSSLFQQYVFNGSSWVQNASGNLPSINPLGINANVFLFAREPFVAGEPGLIQTLNAADWSSTPSLGGGIIKVSAEHYNGEASGLDNPAVRSLGIVPPAAKFALVNQYAPGISVASFQPALGSELTKITILPTPGPQSKAVSLSFSTTAPNCLVLYSINGEGWTQYAKPVWIYKTSSVRYFAQQQPDGILKTPTRTAFYTFATDPSKADSDGDGVPDFVEIARGLNPGKGPDSDGDGFSDLSELLAGTDPNDKTKMPASNQHADEFASFDLKIAPRPFDATANAEVSPLVGVDVHLHDLNGSLLQSSLTQPAPAEVYDVVALFKNVLFDRFPSLLAVGTALNFDIATSSTNAQQGREMVGFVPVPSVQKPVVNYVLGNQPINAEANQWIAAATADYLAAAHATAQATIGVDETLAALVLERKANQILFSRGVEGFNATNLTLFKFRRGDSSRLAPTIGQLTAIALPLGETNLAYDLVALHTRILNAITNDVSAASLRQLAFDVYRTSALSNNAAPGVYPLPIDVLRDFLIDGTFHSAYASASALTDAARQEAFAAASALLAGLESRPIAVFNLNVTSSSFDGGIPKLIHPLSATYKYLYAAPGVGYKFPESFSLIPGSELQITAYTDYFDPNVPGDSLQVIAATLISAPPAIITDDNHNLISDAWEGLFLAGFTSSNDDLDGDGFPDVQEYLDGTDPMDGSSHGAFAVHIAPPILSIKMHDLGSQGAQLGFAFPAAYAARFKFSLERASDLRSTFNYVPVAPVLAGGDQLEIQAPISGAAMSFYRIRMELR